MYAAERRPGPEWKFGLRRRSQIMPTRTSTIFACVIAATLVMSAPHPVAAVIDEFLVYPGSNCIKIAGGTPTYTTNGRLANDTASTMIVQCPMYDNGFDFTGNVGCAT